MAFRLIRGAFCAFVASLVLISLGKSAFALNDDFTFGDFENFKYVSTDYPTNYNNTVPEGWINNGPTPDAVSGPDPTQDTPPSGYNIPTTFPRQPGGGTGESFGNWAVTHNTGWNNWAQGAQKAIYRNSTTTGVTHGTTAIRMNPNSFGAGVGSGNYTQNLSASLTIMGVPPDNNTTIADDRSLSTPTFNAYLASHYIAFDVTFNSADWTHSAFSNTGAAGTSQAPGAVTLQLYSNEGSGTTTNPLVDRFGFHPLGQYVQNTANADSPLARPPDVDSRQSLLGGTGGVYDPGNHTGTYTTTLYYNYAHWQASPTTNDGGAGSGGPPTGVYYDERSFSTNGISMQDDRNGWLEWCLATSYDNGYTGGAIYFDNFRFTNTVLRLGDFNQDGHVNAQDIAAAESALANPSSYEASHDGMTSSDMLTVGDVNGDHVFTGADIQMFLGLLATGHGSVESVPEPSSVILLSIAGAGLLIERARRRRQMSAG